MIFIVFNGKFALFKIAFFKNTLNNKVFKSSGVSFITVAYAQNGAESGVRDFPCQGCDL